MKTTILSLLVALRAVESTNGLDVRAKGNDYQLTKVCVEDVNRVYGTRYRWPEDTKNRDNAENIVLLYLMHYGDAFLRAHGRIPTSEEFARMFHLGYEGMSQKSKKARGDRYWSKVKKAR